MDESRNPARSSLSQSTSYEEMAAFWETHDTTEFQAAFEEVEVEIGARRSSHRVAIAGDLFQQLASVSRQQGVQPETLVNLWLAERLREAESAASPGPVRGSADAESEGDAEKVKG